MDCQLTKATITVGHLRLFLHATNPSKGALGALDTPAQNPQVESQSTLSKHISGKIDTNRKQQDDVEQGRISQVQIEGMLNALPGIDRERDFFYRVRCFVHDCSWLPLLFDEDSGQFTKPSVYLEMGIRRLKSKLDLAGVHSSISSHRHKCQNPVFNWESTFTIFENKVENLLSNNVVFLTLFDFRQKQKLGHFELNLKHLSNFRPVHIEVHLADWVRAQSRSRARLRVLETLDSELAPEDMAKSNLQILTKKALHDLEPQRPSDPVKEMACPRVRLSVVLESPLANLSDYLGESIHFTPDFQKKASNLAEESLIESIYAEPENQLELMEVVVRDVESTLRKERWPPRMDILRLGLGFGGHSGPRVEWLRVHDLMTLAEVGREVQMYSVTHKNNPVFLAKYFKKNSVKMDVYYKALAVFVVPKDIFRLGGARVFLEVGETEARAEEHSFTNRGFGARPGDFDIVFRNGKFEFERRTLETKESERKLAKANDTGSHPKPKPAGDRLLIKEKNGRKREHKLDEVDLTKDMEIVPKFIINHSLRNLQSQYNSPKKVISKSTIEPFLRQPNKHELGDKDRHVNYFDQASRIELKVIVRDRPGLPSWMLGFTREIQELVWRTLENGFTEQVEDESSSVSGDEHRMWQSLEAADQGSILGKYCTRGKGLEKAEEKRPKQPGKAGQWVMDVNCFKLPLRWQIEGGFDDVKRVDARVVLGIFRLKLKKRVDRKGHQTNLVGEHKNKGLEQDKRYRELLKKNLVVLEKLGNVGDTWRVLSREISQKNDMINRMSCQVREKETVLKATCSEIRDLRREIALIDRQTQLVQRKLKSEEDLSVKGLLHVELEHLGEDELKLKLARVAKLYQTERKVNEYYEGMMRQTLLDLGKVTQLEGEFAELQDKQCRGGQELLRLQEEAAKVDLYQETMIRQEKNIILMEKLLEQCIAEAGVGEKLGAEIAEVRQEVEALKQQSGKAPNGPQWSQEMKNEEDQVDLQLARLEKQKYQLERNLLEKRPVVRHGETVRKQEKELENQIFHCKMRIRELEEELKHISTDYLEKQTRLKQDFGEHPVFDEPRVKALEGRCLHQKSTWELLERSPGHDCTGRSKIYLEEKLRAFSKDLKDAHKILGNENKENKPRQANGDTRQQKTLEQGKGLDLLFSKEEQEKWFSKK